MHQPLLVPSWSDGAEIFPWMAFSMASSVAIYLPLQTGPSALRNSPSVCHHVLCSVILPSCCAASLYTSQAPSGLQTQQVLYVPVTMPMMTSITCFPSIYLLISCSSNWAICPLSSFSFLFHAASLYMPQAPAVYKHSKYFMCLQLHLWCQASLVFQVFTFSSAVLPIGLSALSNAASLLLHGASLSHVTSTKQVTNTANTLCACNCTYDAEHHLFFHGTYLLSKYIRALHRSSSAWFLSSS